MKGGGWTRLTLFLAANVAALVLLAYLVVSLGQSVLVDQRRRITLATGRLALARAIASRHAASNALDPADIDGAAMRFLQGETASIQTADLLMRLKSLGDRNAVTLTSVSTMTGMEWRGRSLVGARIEFTASNERVASVIQSIEQGQPLLFIRRAQLQAAGDRVSDVDVIAANLEVYGLPRGPGR